MKTKKTLGVLALAMINVAAILSLRNFPVMAAYGLSSLFFYCLAAVTYLIPTALICAELATTLPQAGGEFRWISVSLNPKWGFLAIWWAWMGAVAFFPLILTFAVSMFAYVFHHPEWTQNKPLMVSCILALFWGCTLVNCLGITVSSRISSLGSLFGTLVPGALIIGLAAFWLIQGHPTELTQPLIWLPEMQWNHWVVYAGVVLGFVGVELSAYHAEDALNPRQDYPKAVFLSTFIILIVAIAGTLAIALVVPERDIHIIEGLMQTYQVFLDHFGLSQWMPVLALLVALGSLATLITWIIGPAKGILAATEHGFIPPWLQKSNRFGAPHNALLAQALVGTVLSCALLITPDIESAYWMMIVLSAQFAVMMYGSVFVAAIWLRISQPHLKRPYQIPGGLPGIILVGGMGLLACLFAFGIGFVPPNPLSGAELWWYEGYLLLAIGGLSLPAVWLAFRTR
jgi:amino acid transporter